MKKIFSLSFIFALGSVLIQALASDIKYYVSTTGNDNANGTTPQTALLNIQKAVEKLENNTPATIYLEENGVFNVYGPKAIIIGTNKKVMISGKNTTLKSGDKEYLGDRIITIGTNSDLKISGLILRNGCTRDGIPGGALFFEGNKLEVDSCTFSSNEANNSGGAIASRGKDVIITNCVFNKNRIFGGYAGAAVIYHCGLPPIDNNASADCSLIIRNTSFTGNVSKSDAKGDIIGFHHAYRGSAYTPLYSNVNYFELANCLFKDNEPGVSPSVRPAASDIYINDVREDFEMNLVNNTFYKTKAVAIPFYFNTPFRLVNNLFYNNADFTIMSSNTSDERDALIAHNNIFVGEFGKNIDDPALTTNKEAYGNRVLLASELPQLGLTPRVQNTGSYASYIPITDKTSILIDNGVPSTLGVSGFDKELIPAKDIRGITGNGKKDIGSFEYSDGLGIFMSSVKSAEKLFTIKRSGDNAIIQNNTDKTLTLDIRLIDGRSIYSAMLENEIVINSSDLEIPNGILILTANDGIQYDSQQAILF